MIGLASKHYRVVMKADPRKVVALEECLILCVVVGGSTLLCPVIDVNVGVFVDLINMNSEVVPTFLHFAVSCRLPVCNIGSVVIHLNFDKDVTVSLDS